MDMYQKIGTFDEYRKLHAEHQRLYDSYSSLWDELSAFRSQLLNSMEVWSKPGATSVEKQVISMISSLIRLQKRLKEVHAQLKARIEDPDDLYAKRQKFVNIKAQMSAIKTRLDQFQTMMVTLLTPTSKFSG